GLSDHFTEKSAERPGARVDAQWAWAEIASKDELRNLASERTHDRRQRRDRAKGRHPPPFLERRQQEELCRPHRRRKDACAQPVRQCAPGETHCSESGKSE